MLEYYPDQLPSTPVTVYPNTFSYIISSASIDTKEIKENTIECDYKIVWELGVPGATKEDITIEVKGDIIEVSFNEFTEDTFFTPETKTIPVKVHYNVKKITSFLEKGILSIEIPFKQDYLNTIKDKTW